MSKDTRAEWQREQERKDVQVQHSIDTRAIESNNIEARAKERRLMRRFQVERREAEMEESLMMMKESEQFRAERIEQDTKLAEELQRVKHDALLEEKRRLIIRESEELKSLEAKLRAAYCVKELDAQCAEKKLAAIREKNNEARMNELARASWEKQKEEEKRIECEDNVSKHKYRRELQDQMTGVAKKRELLFQEFLKDKQMVDEIVRNIQEEDQKAEIERLEKLEKTKREIEEFKKAQAVWRKKQRDEIEDENNRILAHFQNQTGNDQKRLEEDRLREATKAKIVEDVSRQIMEAGKKKKEREDILQLVAEEELMAEQTRKHRAEIEKKLRDRIELRNSFEQQIAEKKASLQREADEEAALRNEMMAQLANDHRIEQYTLEKRRAKMMDFRRDVQKSIEEKRIKRAEDRQLINLLEKKAEEEEKSRLQMIENERLRMLKEHAKNLLGYIPFGVLRESDLPILGPEFVEMYGSKKNKAGCSKDN